MTCPVYATLYTCKLDKSLFTGYQKTRPFLSVYPLPVHVEDGDLFLVAGSVLEGDDLGLPLLARDLHDGGQVMGRASCNPEQNIQRASY